MPQLFLKTNSVVYNLTNTSTFINRFPVTPVEICKLEIQSSAIWNSVPSDTKNSRTFQKFAKRIKLLIPRN